MAKAGEDLQDHLVHSPPATSISTLSRAMSLITSACSFNTPRDTDSITSLGRLFQQLTTLSDRNFFPNTNLLTLIGVHFIFWFILPVFLH